MHSVGSHPCCLNVNHKSRWMSILAIGELLWKLPVVESEHGNWYSIMVLLLQASGIHTFNEALQGAKPLIIMNDLNFAGSSFKKARLRLQP